MSAAGGAAPTETFLIVTRALMGIGGALMWPAILGMTYAILPEDKAGLAGGIIIGAAGLGNAAGPLIGGVLTDLASWRWIFFLNVPIAAFAVAVVWSSVHLHEPEDADHPIDYAGIAAISIGLVSLLIALDQVDDWGWGDPRVIAMLAIARGRDRRFPADRAARRPPRADPARRDRQPRLRRLLRGDPLPVGDLLRRAPLPAPVHGDASSASRRSKRGWGWCPRWPPSPSSPSSPGRSTRGSGPKRLAVIGAGCMTRRGDPLLAGRRRLRLRRPGAGDGGARDRDRQLLPDRDHRRGHLGRRIADEPGGRHRLHVPDRRRLDRAGPDDDDLLRPTIPPFIDGFQAGFRLDAGIALVGLAVSVLFVGGSLLARRAAATT